MPSTFRLVLEVVKQLKPMRIYINYLLIIAIIINITGCGNGGDEIITLANQPPNSFSLLTVNNGEGDVSLKPTLTWSVATDPDHDPITYDLILDNNINPVTVIASDLTETEFTFSTSIQFSEVFYWKVIAKDNMGNSTSSNVFSFSSIELFSQVTDNAAFSGRLGHSSVVFEDKVWVIGGAPHPGNRVNDVWSSIDGGLWNQVTPSAAFPSRASHTSVEFDNKLWVIGGYASNYTNDIWSSNDGVNWTNVSSNIPFIARDNHTTVVFDNKIWVMGGESGSLQILDDVWNSSDGITWEQVNTVGTFPPKSRHSAVVFDNKIWLIAGLGIDGSKKGVWNSSDGITWSEVTAATPFVSRYYHTTTAFDNKLWVIGGITSGNIFLNDVWSSNDGINWTEITSSAPFSKRDYHTSIVFDNKLWVIGGRDANARKNDVWLMN